MYHHIAILCCDDDGTIGCGGGGSGDGAASTPIPGTPPNTGPVTAALAIEQVTIGAVNEGLADVSVTLSGRIGAVDIVGAPVGHGGTMIADAMDHVAAGQTGSGILRFSHAGAYDVTITATDSTGHTLLHYQRVDVPTSDAVVNGEIVSNATSPILLNWLPGGEHPPATIQHTTVNPATATFAFPDLAMPMSAYRVVVEPGALP